MDNRKRYLNVIRNMNLQDEEEISLALKKKGFYTGSETFPLSALHFELTSSCNAYCRHCYNASGGIRRDRMTIDEWIKFSNYLVKKGGMFECLLSGGEPFLLGERVFEIFDILHDDGTILMLMTNGFFIDKNIAAKLSKYTYHWLQLSIDGVTPSYHDWFRGKPGSWEKAVNAARLISENRIPLKIAHCVTPKNLDTLDDMFDFAFELGASSIIAGGISLSGRTSENMDLLLSREQKNILLDRIKENNDKFKGKMIIKTTNPVKGGLQNHSKRPRSNAVIRSNGNIRIDDMAPFFIGNVIDDDFELVWNNKIDSCWKDPRVIAYIAGFDDEDKNNSIINYIAEDVYI